MALISRSSLKKRENSSNFAHANRERSTNFTRVESYSGPRLYSKRNSDCCYKEPLPPLQSIRSRIADSIAKKKCASNRGSLSRPSVLLRTPYSSHQFVGNNTSSHLPYPLPGYLAPQLAGHLLADYEKYEVQAYANLYYLGNKSWSLRDLSLPNAGFTDPEGNYVFFRGDHIAYQYAVISILGRGTYGTVCKAFDYHTQELVAIKVIRNLPMYSSQGSREIKILKKLRRTCDIALKAHFTFRGHVCIVFELLGPSIFEVLQKNAFQGFDLSLVASIGRDILRTLTALHKKSIIHCDLKPENILFSNSERNTVRVIDFGSACRKREPLHSYIQSRFYRAPEVILGLNYSEAIDMWSLGCIFCELVIGTPLFVGNTEEHMLGLMVRVLGRPPEHIMQHCSMPLSEEHSLDSLLQGVPWLLVDLIKKCLDWDQTKRVTAQEALIHPFITGYF